MEKESFFKTRTANHIKSVQEWAEKIIGHYPEFDHLRYRCSVHDQSKFEEPEYAPYLEVTWHYKCKAEGVDYPLDHDAHLATYHHIKNNPHHPEYHDENATLECLRSDNRDKPADYMVDGTKMPDVDIMEMVADWCAVATERGTNPFEWAKMNINVRWKFSRFQEDFIYEILEKIWNK